MGRVAFDPVELQSLAGQLTSTAGSLLGVQGGVIGASADAGLLPSGAGLAAQVAEAVAGLLGEQANLVSTAGEITVAVAAFEQAMAASTLLPVLAQALNPMNQLKEAANLYNWALNGWNSISYDLGHGTAGGMDNVATWARTNAPWAWPAMEEAHQFLGNTIVRDILKGVAKASGIAAGGLALAALVLAPIPGVDLGDAILMPLAEGLSVVNVSADLLLVAGGDKSKETETDLGSAEIGVASVGLGRILGVVKDISVASSVFGDASGAARAASEALDAGKTPETAASFSKALGNYVKAQDNLSQAKSIGTVVSKVSGVSEIKGAIAAMKDGQKADQTVAFFSDVAKHPGQAATSALQATSERLVGGLNQGPAGQAKTAYDLVSHANDVFHAPQVVTAAADSGTQVVQGAQAVGQQIGPKAQKILGWLATGPLTNNPAPGVP